MRGYIPRRTKEVVGSWEVPEGAEPFRATIITSLSFAEIDAIPLGEGSTFGQLFPVIAPYVVAWNAMGRNAETGEYEALPPPAEAGPEVLRLVEPMITTFLAIKLRTAHLGDETERPKDETPSGTTPSGDSAPS
jgi:hypothetical protein